MSVWKYELTATAENRPFIDLGDYNGNANPPSNVGSGTLTLRLSMCVLARRIEKKLLWEAFIL